LCALGSAQALADTQLPKAATVTSVMSMQNG
jgi:hypothetical protein